MKPIFLILAFYFFTPFTFGQSFDYGTKNSEAFTHYQQGWKEILDLGEWTKAEESFRRAAALDPDFKLASAQMGRISNDPEERAIIYTKLKNSPSDSTLESKLVDVYLGSLQLIDAKDRGQVILPDQVKQFYKVSLTNFSKLRESFPDEPYINAEYMEVIHGIYGGQAALDSMEIHEKSNKKTTPFFASYKSQLWAELKDFEQANKALADLKTQLSDSNSPIISFTAANLLFEEGKFNQAEEIVNQTLLADPKHTLAKRLEKQILDQMKNQKD